jgi:hypothetical protein
MISIIVLAAGASKVFSLIHSQTQFTAPIAAAASVTIGWPELGLLKPRFDAPPGPPLPPRPAITGPRWLGAKAALTSRFAKTIMAGAALISKTTAAGRRLSPPGPDEGRFSRGRLSCGLRGR